MSVNRINREIKALQNQDLGRNQNHYVSSQSSAQSFASQIPQTKLIQGSIGTNEGNHHGKSGSHGPATNQGGTATEHKNNQLLQKHLAQSVMGATKESIKNLTLKTQQTKKNRMKIQAQDAIKVENMDQKNGDLGQNVRNNEQGQIQELRYDTYQSKVKINAEQFQSTIAMAIEHFGANYGETLNMKVAVEYAPRFDYNLLEKENKDLRKQHDPVKKELKKEKKNQKNIQLKYDKLMTHVNFTRSLKKRYETKLEELRDQLKDVQFYCNDLDEAVQRERISRENHLLIFKRIINRIDTDKRSYSEASLKSLEHQMKEFVEVAEGKLNPRLMNELQYRSVDNAKKHDTKVRIMNQSTSQQSIIDAKDNPPTTTTRGLKTDRTIDLAHDYIRRLENEVKKMDEEQKFLKSRLDGALKTKNNKSVGSWQNSEPDYHLDDFNAGQGSNQDRLAHYATQPGQKQEKILPSIDPNILKLKLPKFSTQQSEKKIEVHRIGGPDGAHNKDLQNLKAHLRPKTAVKRNIVSTISTKAGTKIISQPLSPNMLPSDKNKVFSSTFKGGSIFVSPKTTSQQQKNTLLAQSRSTSALTPFYPPGIAPFRPQTANKNSNIGKVSPPKLKDIKFK